MKRSSEQRKFAPGFPQTMHQLKLLSNNTTFESDPDIAILETTFKDNQRGILPELLKANQALRSSEWPHPFDTTSHQLRMADARNLDWIPDRSVHLIVTSPPYWTLKQYHSRAGQLGEINAYENFLSELDKAWAECARVLAPGGRICCVVGDVCIPRKQGGRHYVMPLHADIQVRARSLDLDCLTPILWHKIANGAMEAKGNGAGFYGKLFQDGEAKASKFLRREADVWTDRGGIHN